MIGGIGLVVGDEIPDRRAVRSWSCSSINRSASRTTSLAEVYIPEATLRRTNSSS